jgi:hypothetical protein
MWESKMKKDCKRCPRFIGESIWEFLGVGETTENPYKSKPGHRTKYFSNKFHIAESTVAHIETGRMLGWNLPQIKNTTRRYTHARDRVKRAAVEAVRLTSQRVCHNPATNEERRPLPIAVSA